MTLEERLEIWIVAQCCEQSPRPRSRFAELNAIFSNIYNDRRFWRYRNAENRDYYEDAVSLMWRYFIRNLCEVTTARTSGSFLETRTYAVGRLLTNLDGQLKNIRERRQRQFSREKPPRLNEDGTVADPFDAVPNPSPELASLQFEAFLKLLEEDPEGELNDKANTLCGKTVTTKKTYTLTAQTYLLMRHRDDKTIQQIADELGIPRGTLQGRGKPTKWKELERTLAEMAMDSVSE
ncbi:hypothetical protein [Altericista sp. CCNU0014]|uniref:hypothetical protein n=1 Tax=Altericista sp. CCNU0014 TaxID=3082949 RepID=UPI00384F4117